MKKFVITLVAALTVAIGYSQSPEAFQYQAVARDASSNILSNQTIGLEFTLHQGSVAGPSVYTETFTTVTDTFGLVNVAVGTGTPTTGTFNGIDWSAGPYFLEVSMDETGGASYVSMGTTQLLSVPYSLHSSTADTASYANAMAIETISTGVTLTTAPFASNLDIVGTTLSPALEADALSYSYKMINTNTGQIEFSYTIPAATGEVVEIQVIFNTPTGTKIYSELVTVP